MTCGCTIIAWNKNATEKTGLVGDDANKLKAVARLDQRMADANPEAQEPRKSWKTLSGTGDTLKVRQDLADKRTLIPDTIRGEISEAPWAVRKNTP
jgi:hypothetical protein